MISYKDIIKMYPQQTKKFYSKTSIVFSIFRALTPLTTHLITRLAIWNRFIPEHGIYQWAQSQQSIPYFKQALLQLEQLNILRKQQNQDKIFYGLEQNFVNTLQNIFIKGITPCLKQIKNSEISEKINDEVKDHWRRGYTKLYQAVSNPNSIKEGFIKKSVKEVLIQSQLIQSNPKSDSTITKNGFQFILNSTRNQISLFLIQYTKYKIKERVAWKQDIIDFILGLSLLSPKKKYLFEMEKGFQLDIIEDFVDIGFMWKLGKCVSNTELFSNFAFEEPLVKFDIQCDIIVQTNFRVYAQMKEKNYKQGMKFLRGLLDKFIEIQYEFQNFIVGCLTLQKTGSAFKDITYQNILQFFRQNTSEERLKHIKHKKQNMKLNSQSDGIFEKKKILSFLNIQENQEVSAIPNNVIQQLKYWQQKRPWNKKQLTMDIQSIDNSQYDD